MNETPCQRVLDAGRRFTRLDRMKLHPLAGAALCAADTDDGPEPPVVPTADWGYLRLRRSTYGDADLAAWTERIRAQPWREAFVFFKHEDEGFAPRMALQLRSLFAA